LQQAEPAPILGRDDWLSRPPNVARVEQKKSTINNQKSAINNQQSAINNQKSAIKNQQSSGPYRRSRANSG